MTDAPITADPAQKTIQEAIDAHDVVLFMKGEKNAPRCGFSRTVASILTYMQTPFHDVDVLADDAVREGVKAFSNWPTIPQLYVKGEFVGGCDIVTEMTLSGELDALFEAKGVAYDKEAVAEIRARNA